MKIINDGKVLLHLRRYIDKYNKPYYIAYYAGKFRFVHNVEKAMAGGLLEELHNKRGRLYYEYIGDKFELARNGNIYL